MPFTVSEVLSDISAKLQGHPRYTQTMRLSGLNRALEQLLLFTASEDNYDVMEATNPVDPEDSSRYAMEFPLPDRCLYVASVSFAGYLLKPVNQIQYVNTLAEFSTGTGDPRIFYIRRNTYLNIYPRPGRAATMQIYGVIKPEDYTADDLDEQISLNRAYSPALTSYACWWCLQGQPGEEGRAASFMVDYLRERAEAKINLGKNASHSINRWRS
jgi:hypothetical protein